MSDLYNKASLVMTPQLVDTSKVYSIKPENRRGDFDFTRASAATRVGADGNIEKETQNLLLQSNKLNTTWTISDGLIAGSQSDKDGGTSAWKLTNTNPFGRIVQGVTSSGVNTFSIYAKEGNNPYLRMQFQSVGSDAYFDLSDGSVISTEATIIDAGTESVGNGWYRVFASVNQTITDVRIIHTGAGGSGGSSTGDYFYLQDAQLEQGLVARDYIETTTAAVYGGITDNTPRLDYTDSSCPALLLEPQRTNLMTSSEYFQAPYWSETGIGSVQNNVSIIADPTGNYGASKIIPNTTATLAHAIIGNDVSTSTQYTVSIFAKAAEYDYLWIRGLGLGGSGGARFNISTGVVVAVNGYDSATIEDYGNGWYRCIATGTTPPSTTTGPFYHPSPTASYTAYAGSGTSGIYTWGAQVEAAAFATSIIPTYGTSVTRVVETCDDAGDITMINSTEGVLYAEIAALADDLTFRQIALSDGTNQNRVVIRYRTTSNRINFLLSAGGSTILNQTPPVSDITDMHKVAISYKSGDIRLYIDGVKLAPSSQSSSPFTISSLNDLSFNGAANVDSFYGKAKAVVVYKEALTDAELATLTTI